MTNEDLREALAEEQGYHACPYSISPYELCDGCCDTCHKDREFREGIEKKNYLSDSRL